MPWCPGSQARRVANGGGDEICEARRLECASLAGVGGLSQVSTLGPLGLD